MSSGYEVIVLRTPEKEIRRLPPKIRRQIFEKLLELEANPRLQDSVALRGFERGHRVHSGEYRILYDVDDLARVVTVWRVKHRKNVYRNV